MAPRAGFRPTKGPVDTRTFGAKASETIAIGDPVIKDDATGYVSVAAITSTHIMGVAMTSVSSATAGDPILISCHPDTIYEVYAAGTPTQAQQFDAIDISGSTGAFYGNQASTTYGVFKIEEYPDGPGANCKMLGRFVKSEFGTQPASTIGAADIATGGVGTTDIADAAVTADKIAAAVAGNGLTGGAGSALAVGAGNGITVAADSVTLNPDTTTGATVCAATVGANGVGITVDNSTIEHNSNSLRLKDAGITAAKLSATALVATSIPDWAVGSAGYGIPFVCGQGYTDAGTVNIFNANAPFKFRVILWWNHSLDTTASNVKLNDGSNDVSANTAKGTSDHAIVMGGTLDNSYYEIAASGTLAVITDGAGAAGTAYCLCVPVA